MSQRNDLFCLKFILSYFEGFPDAFPIVSHIREGFTSVNQRSLFTESVFRKDCHLVLTFQVSAIILSFCSLRFVIQVKAFELML
jgi:hypothetical protein